MTRSRRTWTGIATGFAALFVVLGLIAEESGSDYWRVAIPGLLTGVGTLALAVTTVRIPHEERRRALEAAHRAAADERARAKRGQADLVSAWLGGPLDAHDQPAATGLWLSNGSDQLVYEAVVHQIFIDGEGVPKRDEDWGDVSADKRFFAHAILAVLPPGRWAIALGGSDHPLSARPGAEIGFTDMAGIHWIRRSNGDLVEIATSAIEHFGYARPPTYVIPQPTMMMGAAAQKQRAAQWMSDWMRSEIEGQRATYDQLESDG